MLFASGDNVSLFNLLPEFVYIKNIRWFDTDVTKTSNGERGTGNGSLGTSVQW